MLKTLPLLTVLFVAPAAEPISGTWQFTGDVGGYPLSDTCTIEQSGTMLRGTCTLEGRKPAELAGEVKDGKFTFKHTAESDVGLSTLIFSGTAASPTELEGTVMVQEHGLSGAFTAKPAPTKP